MKSLILLLALTLPVFGQPDPGEGETNSPPLFALPVVSVGELAIRPAKVQVWNNDNQSDITTAMTSTLWQADTNGQMRYVETWTIDPSVALNTYRHVRWTLATTNATNTNFTYSAYVTYGSSSGVNDDPLNVTVNIDVPWSATNGEHMSVHSQLNPYRFNYYFRTKGE